MASIKVKHMTYEEAIKHLADPTVISAIFNKKTREAVRVIIKRAKEEGLDTTYDLPVKRDKLGNIDVP